MTESCNSGDHDKPLIFLLRIRISQMKRISKQDTIVYDECLNWNGTKEPNTWDGQLARCQDSPREHVFIFLQSRGRVYNRGPQPLGHGPVPVRGLLGTGRQSRRWAAGEWVKLHLPLAMAQITAWNIPPVWRKIVLHETGPWGQKGWGPMVYNPGSDTRLNPLCQHGSGCRFELGKVIQMNVLQLCWNGTWWGLQQLEKWLIGKNGERACSSLRDSEPRGENYSYWEFWGRLAGSGRSGGKVAWRERKGLELDWCPWG